MVVKIKKKKIKYAFNIILLMMFLCLSGCGKEKPPKPMEGKYVSSDGNSYIVLSDYVLKDNDINKKIGECNLKFTNVDLSAFYNFSVSNSASTYVTRYFPDGCSEEEKDDLIAQYKKQIDLNKQFSEKKANFQYFYSKTEKRYGFMCEIEGSGFDGAYETYLTVEYRADEKTIICDEIKYILEK